LSLLDPPVEMMPAEDHPSKHAWAYEKCQQPEVEWHHLRLLGCPISCDTCELERSQHLFQLFRLDSAVLFVPIVDVDLQHPYPAISPGPRTVCDGGSDVW